MPKAKSKSVAQQVRKKNFTSSEVEVLLQEITRRKKIIFSSISAGYTNTNKKEACEAITNAVDEVSGEGRMTEELKKKGSILNLKQKKHSKIPAGDETDWRGNSKHPHPV